MKDVCVLCGSARVEEDDDGVGGALAPVDAVRALIHGRERVDTIVVRETLDQRQGGRSGSGTPWICVRGARICGSCVWDTMQARVP